MASSRECLSSNSLPPGPTEPPWEQARQWIEQPIAFWRRCQATYGDTFTVQLGSLGSTVLFCDPQAVKAVFALRSDHYVCGFYNDQYRSIMGDSSLLVLDGDVHTEQRRLLNSSLHAEGSTDWLTHLVDRTQVMLQEWQSCENIDVRRDLHAAVFDSIVWLLFRDQYPELHDLLRNVFLKDVTKDFGTWSPWARFAKWHPLLRKAISQEIRKARTSPTCSSSGLFCRLASYQQADGEHLSDTQVQDHVFTLLIAGVDPTSIAATWAMYWVLQHEEIHEVLRKDLAPSLALLSPVSDSKWLDAVLKETLRMVPVVTTPSGRKLTRPATIDDWEYPQGVTLLPCTYLVHRHSSVYEHPDEFRPQRFLTGSFRAHEYLPFGGGQRICIGARLADLTLKVLLGCIFRGPFLEPEVTGAIEPVRHGTLLAPSANFRARVRKPT